MATTPAPPGLFSTYTVCPSCFVSSAATERATISEVPPGANGTRKRIGLEGQADCARTHGSASAAAAPMTNWRRCNTEVLFIVGLLERSLGIPRQNWYRRKPAPERRSVA